MAFSNPYAAPPAQTQDTRAHLTDDEVRTLAGGNVAEALAARSSAHCSHCASCAAKLLREKNSAQFRLDD